MDRKSHFKIFVIFIKLNLGKEFKLCQLKRQRELKKIGRIIISLNNGKMIDISLAVVLKINLVYKINQTEFTGRIHNVDKNEK